MRSLKRTLPCQLDRGRSSLVSGGRDHEHWRGNTHVTLTAIIVRTVEQSMQALGGHEGP